MENFTDADYMRAKIVCKNFEIKVLDKYHDLYLKRDTLILTDVFENFKKMHLEIYELDPAPGLTREEALKRLKLN